MSGIQRPDAQKGQHALRFRQRKAHAESQLKIIIPTAHPLTAKNLPAKIPIQIGQSNGISGLQAVFFQQRIKILANRRAKQVILNRLQTGTVLIGVQKCALCLLGSETPAPHRLRSSFPPAGRTWRQLLSAVRMILIKN